MTDQIYSPNFKLLDALGYLCLLVYFVKVAVDGSCSVVLCSMFCISPYVGRVGEFALFDLYVFLGLIQKMAEDASKEKDLDTQQEMDGFPENSDHPEEVQGVGNDLGAVKEKKWPGWPGENVFRLLIPVQKVGVIIGRKGECIKKVCEETKARIKVLDAPPGTTERTVSN